MLQDLHVDRQLDDIFVSIVIPFFNEEKNVGFVMEELINILKTADFSYEIIPVNNGSTDNTGRLLQEYNRLEWVKTITVKENQGLGWGIRQGFDAAAGKWICFFGGDGQTRASDAVKMLEIIHKRKDIDFVTGCRLLRGDGALRGLISKIFNISFRCLFNMKLKDINGTPKVMGREFIRQVNLNTKGWFIDAELLLKAKACNLTIMEHPVVFRRRNSGKTHISIYTIAEFIREMLSHYFFKGA